MPKATIAMAKKKRPSVDSLYMTFPLPFAGKQVFAAPVSFDELPAFLCGVAAEVVKSEAHPTVLIDQLHARLLPAAYVAVAEFERRDLVGATMNMVVATRPLDYAFGAVLSKLKPADDVRRYPARPRRHDKFPEFADVCDYPPEQARIHASLQIQLHLRNEPN